MLREFGLQPDKSLGQNFLIDASVLAAILKAAEIAPENTVLEVGPGLGVLTRELAVRAGRVVAVEFDRRLLPVLEETLTASNLELACADAMTYDLDQLPAGSLLVANLPYNIATPLLARLLESGRFKRLVFLIQREVAERLTAPPGEESFGALSLLVAYFGTAKVVRTVKPSAFFPAPEVSSSVVRLEMKPDVCPDPALFKLIKTAFAHRRKTLKKNLRLAGFEEKRVTAALERLELDPRIRAEALGLEQFQALAHELGVRAESEA